MRRPVTLAIAVVIALGAVAWLQIQEEPRMSATVDVAQDTPSNARLQVVGIGVIIEKLRQSDAWVRIRQSAGQKAIPEDPALYESIGDYKSEAFQQRQTAALEWGLRAFVEGWPVPYVFVDHANYTRDQIVERSATDWLESIRPRAGLHWHQIRKVSHIFTDRPAVALEVAFRFFEENEDAPALLLFVRARGNHDEGPRRYDDPTESVVVLLLARRDRIDWLRNFAPYARKGDNNAPEFQRWKSDPPVPFTPTQYIPKPWTPEQIAQFDALPTLAVIHRPVTVPYRKLSSGEPVHEADKDSVPMTDDEKLAAFAAAWKKAMSVLPRTPEGALHPRAVPARLFFDFGDASNARAIVPVTRHLMHNADPQAMRLDVMDPKVGFNTFNILGDTRTASPMVQWAVGSIATWKEKDVSVTLDLRSPHGATITVITPDTSPQNLARKHPGGDPIDFSLR